MSRSKIRNVDQIHQLKREIKQLNETIKKLERKLNNEAKKEKPKPIPKTEIAEPVQSGCPDCNKGKIEIIDLSFRKMLICTEKCGYRKVIKNG
jgi:predicted phage-related endonuclease